MGKSLTKVYEDGLKRQGSKTDPQTQGFDLDKSLSTTSLSYTVAPQEAVDSQGAIVPITVMEKRTSKDTPREEKEEEEDDDDTDVDAACAPDVSSSSSSPSPTTAYIVPSNNDMHIVTYGLIVDDRTRDSTVVEEEREVLVADSSSSYPDRKGTVEEGEEKQKGDPDS